MFDSFFDSREVGTTAKKSITLIVSIIIHVVLIGLAVILPLLFPETVSGSIQRLTFLVTPPLPPAPPPAPPPEATVRRIPRTAVDDAAFQIPVEIPQEVLMVMDEAPPPASVIAGIAGGIPGGIPGGVLDGVIHGVIGGAPASMDPLPLPPAQPQVKPPQRLRVGGNVQRANLIRQVRPRYPWPARQARIQGTVILEAIISEQGSVENLRVVKGHPLLIRSALEAVRRWRYKPTVLNGVPVEVITRITVRFNLA